MTEYPIKKDSPTIVGIGIATLDILVRLGTMPTWEKGCAAEAIAFDGGGMVGTALSAAVRLGVPAGFIGTVGAGAAGQVKLASLVEFGVDVRHIQTRPEDERQIVLVCVRQSDGERTFTGVRGLGDQNLDPSHLPRDYITAAHYLLLDGFHSAAALVAAKWMRQAGKTVVLDAGKTSGPVGESMRALVSQTDVLVCGEGFAPALTGCADRREAGQAALQHGPRIVVQTEGAAGSYTTAADDEFHTPAFEVEVIDTTGAGDVFHGAYIVGLAKGYNLRDTARFASAVAAIKCTGLGGRRPVPTFEKTTEFLALHGSVL